ncbi:MAG: serine O-acetyltransferase [Oscillospiraceae bacterium]|nr:serine O-acetyltransferase [Oscillospiraceae bacterium]MDD3261975.1 serine O-acetyltransferase [Oscillospiraceae bacterium]
MFKNLKSEIDSIMDRDPAARSRTEVYFLYSGFKAVRSYRHAHWWLEKGHPFIARWISQRARHKTGIEIHPGAKIGKGLFIDHGMGVVIGETTEIGDNCTLYQGVTLGGTGKDKGKRHPTLGNNVLVGSGAKILGPMKIGDNARIAAGAVVLDEVPANATAVGVPARVVRINGVRPNNLDQVHVTDPVSQELCRMNVLLEHIEKRIGMQQAEDDRRYEENYDLQTENAAKKAAAK